MRKMFALVLTLICVLAFTGCNKNDTYAKMFGVEVAVSTDYDFLSLLQSCRESYTSPALALPTTPSDVVSAVDIVAEKRLQAIISRRQVAF